ncbi:MULTISPECIES: PadR family transcriptional regulator [Halorussus]|uniref:PadR family transcriptional regulator n=1 Tax=Halorussus TaxID=1070314 RepID=UPI00209EB85A|nr:PadR family transcriptional regulator [Halorussus vallis]USZ77741.1 PadR family transcriptional regulator [Halorussus vallis]USZ77742.1 PadR family transcriptional regulator [Halorussus vallis]
MDDYTRFQIDLLTVIAGYETGQYQNNRHSGECPHGLAIKDELDDRYQDTEIHHGRLYPNLDTLVNRGLVEKAEHDRRTNQYQLTNAGWKFLQQRAEWMVACLDGGDR